MEKIRFDNFVSLNRGFDLPDDKIIEGKYPVIASTSIKAYHNQFKVKAPIVVTGRSGSLGKVQYVDEDGWPLNTALYAKDFHGNNPKYVYYFLQTMHLEQYNAGAGVPTLNQNHLHSLKILIHELPTQQKIASILSAYDNLIQNYKKQIEALQTAASELYKEWFVRFRFPGWQTTNFENGIPEGWNYKRIFELYNTTSGGTPARTNSSYYENGTIPWVKTGELLDTLITDTEEYITEEGLKNSSAKIIEPGSLLCSMYAGVGKLGINVIPMTCSQATCVFTPKSNISIWYLFFWLMRNKEYLESISFGAAQQNISQDIIKKITVLFPSESVTLSFDEKIKPIYKKIQNLMQQISNLTQQRDLLLPRLMSGKLEVE